MNKGRKPSLKWKIIGYASVDYFAGLFKDKTEKTPEQYRISHLSV